MPVPARNTLAIIGAGPIGLEAASAALDAGLDVHVFERGEVGAHAIAWGHLMMFTPWGMNLGPSSAARLVLSGWIRPDSGTCPTGDELAEQYLQPLARLPELHERVHTHAQVVFVSRSGALKSDGVGSENDRGMNCEPRAVRIKGAVSPAMRPTASSTPVMIAGRAAGITTRSTVCRRLAPRA